MKEPAISAGLRSADIQIIGPAMVPTSPARPAKAKNITLAFLVGLVGGIGLALLREYLDNTVKSPDDIEALARLPSLAVVPQFSGSSGGNRRGFLPRSEEHTSELQSRLHLVCRLLLEKKKKINVYTIPYPRRHERRPAVPAGHICDPSALAPTCIRQQPASLVRRVVFAPANSSVPSVL